MKHLIVVFIISNMLLSCQPKVREIAYGEDTCHYCSMTIVDKQHAAQLVTKKGKAFKFDASECMLNHLKSKDITTMALFKANDFNEPGVLLDATKASFLISDKLPSPMGAFLTAFKTTDAVEFAKEEFGGKVYNWIEIQNHFKK